MKVGILGAGQLGRMLALAGVPLGVDFVFYDHNPDACASGLGHFMCGEFEDEKRLSAFADQVDVVTIEFENIPIGSLEQVARRVPVLSGPQAVRVAQDRLNEKTLFTELGIPTPDYYPVENAGDLKSAGVRNQGPLIVKSRRFGYDGKGQAPLEEPAMAGDVWGTLGGVPLIAERRIEFTREVSMIAVRNRRDEIRFYPLTENVHQDGILVRSRAVVGDPLQSLAEDYTQRVMRNLDYVGVLAFEFFDICGTLMANEIAPRVHNSGHWSIEGAVTSQFENHIRAILDWPLGDTTTRVDAVMYNLIGKMPDRSRVLGVRGAHLHDYGKQPRPGRKLGHVTLCNPTVESLRELETALSVV